MKTFFSIFLITTALFLFTDFLLSSLKLDPKSIHSNKKNVDGIKHEIYHHDLKPNLRNTSQWGSNIYPMCTNEFGFRISCDDVDKKSNKNVEIAFIGDSFTEGIGIKFEDTFVGKFAKKNEHISIANFGVRSYSPIIYYKKIKYLLDNGFTFNNLIVVIDIGDINDEAIRYTLSKDEQRVIDREKIVTSESQHKKESHLQSFIANNFKYVWSINNYIYDYFNPQKNHPYGINHYKSLWPNKKDLSGYGAMGVQGAMDTAVFYMEKLKKLLDEKGITLTILVYPWPTQLVYKERNHDGVRLWENFCERMNCKQFINANDIFFDELEHRNALDIIEENYITGDEHFNERGNAKIYEVLQKEFRE